MYSFYTCRASRIAAREFAPLRSFAPKVRPDAGRAQRIATAACLALFLSLFLPVARSAPVQGAYIKASNTGFEENFGSQIAISGDTMVVGAPAEDSSATGVNGDQNDTSAFLSGAAYIFVRDGTNWTQQAYLKASNTEMFDEFGSAVAISGDTVVIGARGENSGATGVNGDQLDSSAPNAGAVYVFVRTGTNWAQQAYLKASNTGSGDWFGYSVAIAGETIVVGATRESSIATGVNGLETDDSSWWSGAAYVFVRTGTNWAQQAYLKASNTGDNDQFGGAVSISGDTIVVGAGGESSAASGVNGDQTDNNASHAGAAYVFVRSGTNWSQQAYLKASNSDAWDVFGLQVALSGDTLVVGAHNEFSDTTGVNAQTNNNLSGAGAAYIFVRSGTNWSQQAFLKASNTGEEDHFGKAVAICGDTVAVGAPYESSNATGVNGSQNNELAPGSGAVYLFTRIGAAWAQQAYVKASNTGTGDSFGWAVALATNTMGAGAPYEASSATGVNGNQADDSTSGSGAAYVFHHDTQTVFRPQLSILPDGNRGYYLRFQGTPSVRYQLDRAEAINGTWRSNGTATAPASGAVEFHDTNPPRPNAFYRVLVLP